MLIFGLCSNSDDRPGWLMDSNPVCHPSPAKKMKCSFSDYIQLLMIGWAGRWTRTPSTTPLQPKNKMLVFGLRSTSDDWLGCSMDSNPICHLSPARKIKCPFSDYVQLLIIGRAGRWTQTPSTTPLQAKKMKCLFLDYIQLLMIGRASQWTRTPSTTPLQPKNEMLVLDYIQLLMISWVGQWTRTPFTTPLQPKK